MRKDKGFNKGAYVHNQPTKSIASLNTVNNLKIKF